MRRRLRYAAPACLIATLALAAVLTATAAGGSAAGGQTLQLASAGTDVDHSDPALAYGVLSWEIEYNTCSKLLNNSDVGGRVSNELTPDAAAGMPVISKDGKTYTFTIRSGIKFSNGADLTADSFKAAMNRDANPAMNSPVNGFMTDVAGWSAVNNKKAKTISGVVVRGNKLIIHLTEKDGGMLDKLAMPFFCAIDPATTPVNPNGLTTVAGSGPYYIASRTVGKQIVLKQNPNYTGNRPHRSAAIILTTNTNSQQTFLQVSNGTYATDPNGLDNPSAASSLAKKYGINKSRFFVHATPETDYIALNTARPTFASTVVRRAVNFAIDRPALLRTRGFLGGQLTTEILPASLSGGVTNQRLYPLKGAQAAKAKQLAGGTCGNVNLWYTSDPVGTPQAGILKFNLQQMGCNVTTKPFQGYAIYTAAGVKGTDMDAMFAGWYQDYADGYDFFHILLDGRTIATNNNNNLAYFNAADVDKRIDAANLLTGPARAKAWGRLDIYTMQKYAPWAPIDNRNVIDYIGPKTAGYVFNPPYGAMDLATLYLK